MPWHIKRVFALIVLGFAAAVLAMIVIVDAQLAHVRLLAIGLFIGAAAMILVSLPENGKSDGH